MSDRELEMSDELPSLPAAWTWSSVSKVGEVITGSTPSKSKPEYFGGDIPLFKPTDLNAGYNVRQYTDSLTAVGGEHARLLPAGSVLVTCIGATIGKTGIARVPCTTNQQINALVPQTDAILSAWAYFYFTSSFGQRQIKDSSSATTLPILNKGRFCALPFPVAPLPEQHRIVSKIEELFSDLDAGVSALERAKANLKRYRASVLKAAVEGRLTADWRAANPNIEPASELLNRILTTRRQTWEANQLAEYERKGKQPPTDWKDQYSEPDFPKTSTLPRLPKSWCWATAEQMGEIQLGRQRSPKNRSKDFPTKYIRAANITESGIDTTDIMDMEFTPSEFERYRMKKGDIVVSEASGSPDQVGKPAVWNDEIPDCCFQNTVIRLRPDGISSDYLLVVFKHCYVNKVFAELAGGVGINHLSAGKFSRIPIPLPPAEEQAELVGLVERGLSIIAKANSQLDMNLVRASRLRQGTLKRAFEGKLVPQNASEEPAASLLARVAAMREKNSEEKVRDESPNTGKKASRMKKPQRRPLLDVLHDQKNPISPERLMNEAGFLSEEIDEFYAELRTIKAKIKEVRPSEEKQNRWPYDEKIAFLIEAK